MPSAILYRMVLSDHECPFGRHAKEMLEQAGIEIEENILSTREEVEAFKTEHGVTTTPLIWVDGQQVGGSNDLESFLAANG